MKKLLLFIIISFGMFDSYAQIIYQATNDPLEVIDTGNITRERWRDSLLRMDMNRVPTGFLLEYSLSGFDSDKFDGTGNDDDTLTGDGQIFALHNTLWYSKVNSNATIDETDSLFSKAFFENRNNHTIPLTFIYQQYNRIRQSALSEGLFTIAADSVGILDVPGRPKSPYDTLEIFAFAPFKTNITQFNAIQFTLPDDLFYMQGITNVDIDFGDGAGFRTLSKGGNVSIYYNTEGLKYITAKITTPGGIRTAKSRIDYTRPVVYTTPDYSLNIEVPPVYTNDIDYLNAGSARPMGGPVVPCGGSYFEQLLCGVNPSANIDVENGCDKVFDKPIIVVEGFDPTGSLTLEEMKDRFRQEDFMATMQGYGYDFVFVDFTANTTYIENNAKVLEAVINWVNEHKTGTHKSTVIGFSMGGLVARWCLKDMEDRSVEHNVENYFSYDAPHQGANIPLGMQYLFKEIERDLPEAKWFSKDFRLLAGGFNSSAAKQMLVTYADYNNGPFNWVPKLNTLNPVRAAFAERLKDKGYPQQTNNFGIALGRGNNTLNTKDAGDGQQFKPGHPFNPESLIFAGSMVFVLANVGATGYAVPENNNKAMIANYMFSGITVRKIFGIPILTFEVLRKRRFDYTGQYPYDDGQGSFEQTQTDFANAWISGLGVPGTTDGHDGHNFVATASSLDLQNQSYSSANDWQSANIFYNVDNQIQNAGQVNGNTLLTSSLSPFDAVMTSTSDCGSVGCDAYPYQDEDGNLVFPQNTNQWNHYHNTSITSQTARFIERNILKAQPIDCAGGNGLCNTTPGISGPNIICTDGQYQLTDPPNGVTIAWEMQNGKLRITDGQGTPAIDVEEQGTGSEIVKVKLTNSCGASLNLTKTVSIGAPNISSYKVIGPGTVYSGAGYYYSVSSVGVPPPVNIYWSVPAGWTITNGQGTQSISVWTGSAGGVVEIDFDNFCGEPTGTYKTVVIGTGGPNPQFAGDSTNALKVTPNPANSNVTVSLLTNNTKMNSGPGPVITEIKVIDKVGTVRKRFTFNNRSASQLIDISGLPVDTYVIQAFTGTQWLSAKLLIVNN